MSPRLPMNYFKFPDTASNDFEVARKSGDLKKGDRVNLTGVNSKGQFSATLPSGAPSEHWHSLEAFYPNRDAANDNG